MLERNIVFDCMHKYKIGDRKIKHMSLSLIYKLTIYLKKVDEQISNKKTGLVSYILFENNKILVDQK